MPSRPAGPSPPAPHRRRLCPCSAPQGSSTARSGEHPQRCVAGTSSVGEPRPSASYESWLVRAAWPVSPGRIGKRVRGGQGASGPGAPGAESKLSSGHHCSITYPGFQRTLGQILNSWDRRRNCVSYTRAKVTVKSKSLLFFVCAI